MSVHIFKPMLDYIEKNLDKKIEIDTMAKLIGLSSVHMNRLFTFAYGMSVAKYVRKRKLSESLSDLLQEKYTILETALSYGFEYEQSFTRAFKMEFGMTPGEYRKSKPVLTITPPFCNLGTVCEKGLFFEPEIVLFPKIFLLGMEQKIPYRNSIKLAQKTALNFWDKYRFHIENGSNQKIFYGLTHHLEEHYSYTHYLTAIEAKEIDDIPAGMKKDVFGGFYCVKFHYIGRHSYRELSRKTAKKMYDAIEKYFYYHYGFSGYPKIHLEKIDSSFAEKACLLEWFAPVLY